MACASGVLHNLALAFNLPDDDTSRANAAELTTALASLVSSTLCPQDLNLKANYIGKIIGVDQFRQIANRCARPAAQGGGVVACVAVGVEGVCGGGSRGGEWGVGAQMALSIASP